MENCQVPLWCWEILDSSQFEFDEFVSTEVETLTKDLKIAGLDF